MTIAKEEIFGPVLCIIAYENEEEAVHIANDTPLDWRHVSNRRMLSIHDMLLPNCGPELYILNTHHLTLCLPSAITSNLEMGERADVKL